MLLYDCRHSLTIIFACFLSSLFPVNIRVPRESANPYPFSVGLWPITSTSQVLRYSGISSNCTDFNLEEIIVNVTKTSIYELGLAEKLSRLLNDLELPSQILSKDSVLHAMMVTNVRGLITHLRTQ